MASLIIPYGSPVGWVMRNGVDTLNAGEVYFPNTIYPKDGGFSCGTISPPFCQVFDCSDVLTIQIRFSEILPPDCFLEIIDENGDIVALDLFTDIGDPSGDVFEAQADFSAQPCPACYYLRLRSYNFDGETNLYNCGDSGTFETGTPPTWNVTTGPNNTITKDNTIFYQGANSAAITAGATPAAGDTLILKCYSAGPPPVPLPVTLTANTVYEISAYVYDSMGSPWTTSLSSAVSIEIADGFTDATIISQTTFNPNNQGYDTWAEIRTLIHIGADNSGTFSIESSELPLSNGIINVDAIQIQVADTIEEARSQWICTRDLTDSACGKDCFTKITYYNDDDSSGMVYTLGLQNFFWIKLDMRDGRWEDANFDLSRSSAGVARLIKSQMAKIYTLESYLMPEYMHQILAIASKHDNFLIDSYPFQALDAPYQPEYEERVKIGRVELPLIDKNWNVDNTYC